MTRFSIGEDVEVLRDGETVDLPPSRKTRALLAFLLLRERSATREHLCDMFWDRAADPRGGLRWALAKLRRALGDDEDWLIADRLSVKMQVPADCIDFDESAGDRLLGATLSGEHDEYAAFVAALREGRGASPDAAQDRGDPAEQLRQEIRYTKTPDGTSIAYSAMGKGPPLLKAANWLTHLEADMDVPVWSGLYTRLAHSHRLYRYDERGNGLSDWEVEDLSFDSFVSDLECVADALGLERFPLLGISQGGAVSIEYAARHPERVSALILVGAYPVGWRSFSGEADRRRREAEITLVEEGWGDNSPAYRQIFSHSFLPDASSEDIDRFNEFQKQTTSAANAARFIHCFGDIDVRDRLDEVQAPALILHSRGDRRAALSVGRDLAASLGDAQFETLPTGNHVPLAGEPAFDKMMAAMTEFLAGVE
ncbi:alpha/beta hydrolase [Alteraurantiacibacter aquimixticola]|uniref:Alpha/beta hydrolase n=1 Tax=Alteraurantiacibacter aquimixticola TaxID=2489173 RepID=A0A4T3EXQ1_9SPHN|nr:alpha/beta hydrolase [Alteraurantiacibacter aquimixticola]TIX48811.1 alpha/beta hydrolase [Alteraurantiacibacter aquimixticola]